MAKAREKRTFYMAEVDDDGAVFRVDHGTPHSTAENARKMLRNMGSPDRVYAVIAQCGPAFTVEVKTTERRSIVPVAAQETEGTEDG